MWFSAPSWHRDDDRSCCWSGVKQPFVFYQLISGFSNFVFAAAVSRPSTRTTWEIWSAGAAAAEERSKVGCLCISCSAASWAGTVSATCQFSFHTPTSRFWVTFSMNTLHTFTHSILSSSLEARDPGRLSPLILFSCRVHVVLQFSSWCCQTATITIVCLLISSHWFTRKSVSTEILDTIDLAKCEPSIISPNPKSDQVLGVIVLRVIWHVILTRSLERFEHTPMHYVCTNSRT